jgi:hypothetical protein
MGKGSVGESSVMSLLSLSMFGSRKEEEKREKEGK